MKNLRIHPYGYIEAELSERISLHVWHPQVPRPQVLIDIHNHRQAYKADVIAGELEHVEYKVIASSKVVGLIHRTHDIYFVSQNSDGNRRFAPCLNYGTEGAGIKVNRVLTVVQGNYYTLKEAWFHKVFAGPSGKAATIVTPAGIKNPKIDRLALCEREFMPDNFFDCHQLDNTMLNAMIRDVLKGRRPESFL